MTQANRRATNLGLEILFEILGLVIAWHGTVYLRLALNPYMALHFSRAELDQHAPPLSAILFFWILVDLWIKVARPARSNRSFRFGDSLMNVAESGVLASTLAIVVTFFCRQFGAGLSRSFVLLFLPVSFVGLILSRHAQLWLMTACEKQWPAPERVAVLGQGPEARRIVDRVQSAGNGDLSMTGIILPELGSSEGLGAPVLGTTRRLAELINQTRLDRIIFVKSSLTDWEVNECEAISQRMGVVLSHAVAPAGVKVRLDFADLCGMPLVNMRPITFGHRQELIKRLFDIVVSAAALVLLSPVLLLIALFIRLHSEGPVLYKSSRVGRGGRHFTFLKFRSMYHGKADRQAVTTLNEKNGHIFKMRKDSRVTPLGAFMRKYSIDELPQLWNVLRGDMSLIGPRPLPAEDLDPDGQSREFAFWSEQRSRVLPGITGLWQIRGRSDLSFEEMVQLDIDYIRNWSLNLDFRILLATPLVVATGRGAY